MVNFYPAFLGAEDVGIEKVVGKLLDGGKTRGNASKILLQNTSTTLSIKLDMIV